MLQDRCPGTPKIEVYKLGPQVRLYQMPWVCLEILPVTSREGQQAIDA